MKKSLMIALAVICGCMFTAFASVEGHKFVGAGQCKMCHSGDKKGNQFQIWEKSKHAEAYKALESDSAKAIVASKGLKQPATESAECLACHVGVSTDPAQLDKKFDMKLGVQCEACHGAGSDFKAMSIMKDKEKAYAAGLVDVGALGEKLCTKCHNDKSPNFTGFNYEEMWAKIKHMEPAKQ
jgi:hypothetical protein